MTVRFRSAPLWAHAIGLGLVLAALFPLVGMRAAFTADEGAAILQARQLEDGLGWIQKSPLPTVDPQVDAGLVPLADVGSKGRAPYGKHPLLPVVLAGGENAFGIFGLVLPAMIGTVLAAFFAGCAARLLGGRGDARWATVWLVGIGSPLLFASYLATGTALAAAGASCAGAAALTWLAAGSGRGRLALATLGVAGGCAIAVAMRTEGLLYGAALAAALGVDALVELGRRGWRSAAGPGVLAAAAAVGALGARLVERQVVKSFLGTASSVASLVDHPTGNVLAAKLAGIGHTWFEPASPGSPRADLVVAATVLIPAAALLVRRRVRLDLLPLIGLAVVVLYAVRASAAFDGGTIPGLLVAAPVLLAGLCLVTREGLRGPGTVAAVAIALFALAVAATQYSFGGVADWGGRFFAIGVPLAMAVAVAALAAHRPAAGGPLVARYAGWSLVACVALVAVTAVQGVAHSHLVGERLMAGIGRAAARTDPGPRLPGAPIAVTDQRPVPQIVFESVRRVRWLAPETGDVRRFTDALAAAEVRSFVLVSVDVARSADALGPGWRFVDDTTPIRRGSAVHVLVVERAT